MVKRTTTTDYMIKNSLNWAAPRHVIESSRDFTVTSSKQYLTFPSDIDFEVNEFPVTVLDKATGKFSIDSNSEESKDFHINVSLKVDSKTILCKYLRVWVEIFLKSNDVSLWEIQVGDEDLDKILSFVFNNSTDNISKHKMIFIQPTQYYKIFMETNAGNCDISYSSINLVRNN